MDISESVDALRAQGNNCAQTVVGCGLERNGIQNPALLDAFLGFGHGLQSGRICGCVAGAAAVFSVAVLPHDATGRMLVRTLTRDFAGWFEQTYGSTECAVLKKTSGGRAPVPCDTLILESCRRCDELLTAAGVTGPGAV